MRKRPCRTSSTRLRLVAAIIRASMGMGRELPTRSKTLDSKTRSSLACNSSLSSPISSRNRVPPLASSKRPTLWLMAPVKAPLTWPNNSDSMRVSTRAEQLKATKGPWARGLFWWMAWAKRSLPVPDSPSMTTVASDPATSGSMSSSLSMAGLLPMISTSPGMGGRFLPPGQGQTQALEGFHPADNGLPFVADGGGADQEVQPTPCFVPDTHVLILTGDAVFQAGFQGAAGFAAVALQDLPTVAAQHLFRAKAGDLLGRAVEGGDLRRWLTTNRPRSRLSNTASGSTPSPKSDQADQDLVRVSS